jgi:hypothetical protein
MGPVDDRVENARARADAALERTIAAHRRAIDHYIVLGWPDKEALERECLREAVHEQAASRTAMAKRA